jgi:hypothetical protein
MLNLDKKFEAMNITLTIAKVAFVTVAAFFNPWLVIPALIIAELVSTKFQNTPAVEQPEATISLNTSAASVEAFQPLTQELVIEKVEELEAQEEPKKKSRKKRSPKLSDDSTNQQVKTSRPKGRRSN